MLSATYLAWAVGPMMQLDSISVSDAADGRAGVFSLRLQNNGLGDFVGSHKACTYGCSLSYLRSHGYSLVDIWLQPRWHTVTGLRRAARRSERRACARQVGWLEGKP